MQILKEDIREAIRKEAREEFFAKGYEGSSLRRIAAAAGTTAGNLYRYYPGKRELFSSIVEPAFKALIDYARSHEESHRDLQEEMVAELMDSQVEIFSSLIAAYRMEIYILFKQSKGTPYEQRIQKFMTEIQKHSLEHIDSMNLSHLKGPLRPVLSEAMVKAYMEGWLHIIKIPLTRKEMTILGKEYLRLYLLGPLGAIKETLT